MKQFPPFEVSGDIVHVKKSGCFDVDVVLKLLFIRVGELSDDICNRLDHDEKIILRVTFYISARCLREPRGVHMPQVEERWCRQCGNLDPHISEPHTPPRPVMEMGLLYVLALVVMAVPKYLRAHYCGTNFGRFSGP
jgi:hypothetical protein